MAHGAGGAEHAGDQRVGDRFRGRRRYPPGRTARGAGGHRGQLRGPARRRRHRHGARPRLHRPGRCRRARRRAARPSPDPGAGLQDARARPAGQQLLGRLAHAPAAGPRADVPERPAAARRAHQPPGPRRPGLARGVAAALCRHDDRHQPRPGIPGCRHQRHAAHRQCPVDALWRQLQQVRGDARAAHGAAAGRLRQAAGEDRPPAEVHRPLQGQGQQGQAGAEPRQGPGAHGEGRAAAGRGRLHLRIQGTRPHPQSDAVDQQREFRLPDGGRRAAHHPARRQPLGAGRPAHRHPGRQWPGQVDIGQDHRARDGRHRRDRDRRQGTEHRLFRAAGTRRPAPPGHAPGAHGAHGARTGRGGQGAERRAGPARLPGQLQLQRRHGQAGGGHHERRREGTPGAGHDGLAAAQPPAARRAHQPPRPRHPGGPGRGAQRVRRHADAGQPRSRPAALGLRRVLDGRAWRRDGFRWRPRRLPALSARGGQAPARGSQGGGAPQVGGRCRSRPSRGGAGRGGRAGRGAIGGARALVPGRCRSRPAPSRCPGAPAACRAGEAAQAGDRPHR